MADILSKNSSQIVHITIDALKKKNDLTLLCGFFLVFDLHLVEIDLGFSVIGGCDEISDGSLSEFNDGLLSANVASDLFQLCDNNVCVI